MADMKAIVGVVLAVAIASILLGPIVTAVGDNTGVQEVQNETVTANVGNYTTLDGYYIQENSETVYNSTGATMSEGTDYELNYDEGSIKALSGGDIADGSEINATYDWEATKGQTTTVIGYGPVFVALLLLTAVGMKVTEMM